MEIKRGLKCFLSIVILIAMISIVNGSGTKNDTNAISMTYRIGYIESESFVNYSKTLYALLEALNEVEWINNLDKIRYTDGQNDTLEMWKDISKYNTASNIDFVENAHYSLTSFDKNDVNTIIEDINKNKLDLIIVMGTAAGRFISESNSTTPFMVFATSNAVQSKIIESETDSGREHVWAHMDPKRFERQLSVFYEIFEFKNLGIVCEDSAVAKNYSAVDDIEHLAQQKGFNVTYKYVNEPVSSEDVERYYAEVEKAYIELSQKVDSMYVTVASLESEKLPELLEPFHKENIPVFSQLGDDEVKNGALMSITVMDYKNIGRFGANTIIEFFGGKSLRLLPQVFESTPQIILNMEVADKIGYRVPFDILLSADRIYTKIGDEYDAEE